MLREHPYWDLGFCAVLRSDWCDLIPCRLLYPCTVSAVPLVFVGSRFQASARCFLGSIEWGCWNNSVGSLLFDSKMVILPQKGVKNRLPEYSMMLLSCPFIFPTLHFLSFLLLHVLTDGQRLHTSKTLSRSLHLGLLAVPPTNIYIQLQPSHCLVIICLPAWLLNHTQVS